MAFKVGDVVMLKSGGTPMTVDEVDLNNDGVRCVWQNVIGPNNHTMASHVFGAEMLELRSDVVERVRQATKKAAEKRAQRVVRPYL